MRHSPVPLDTDPGVYEAQVARWRSMALLDRVALIDQICADVEMLAIAGIRAERPALSEVEIRYELARRRYGSQLADEAFEHLPIP